MKTEEMIPLAVFCEVHKVEIAFIHSLDDHGLVEIVSVEQAPFLPLHQLATLEQLIRLHHDLQLDADSLGVVHHLLTRIDELQREITSLRNRL